MDFFSSIARLPSFSGTLPGDFTRRRRQKPCPLRAYITKPREGSRQGRLYSPVLLIESTHQKPVLMGSSLQEKQQPQSHSPINCSHSLMTLSLFYLKKCF